MDRDQVERLAAQMWKAPSPAPVDDGTSYWVSTRKAAEMLGVGSNRIRQLVDRGFLPCLRSPQGRLIFRRHQLEVIANARLARRLQKT